MADIKVKYPASDSVALTMTIASLASSSTLLGGQQATVVDNTALLDLDHLVSGKIRVGTSPTAGGLIELWVFAPLRIVSGTPTYPDVMSTTDAARTLTSDRVKQSALRRLWSTDVDGTSDRDYFVPPTSIANMFGMLLPKFWGLFLTHSTGVALNATGTNHFLHYERQIQQLV